MIQPQSVGFWHLASVYLLVWAGAFFGTSLGAQYVAEHNTWLASSGNEYSMDMYYKVCTQ